MTSKRADLGFGSALDDLGSFDPKPKSVRRPKLPKEDTAKAAESAGFKSREPKGAQEPKKDRRRRTGRNAQFNIKAKPETIEAYYEIADTMGWGLGETLEYAVDLLKNKHLK